MTTVQHKPEEVRMLALIQHLRKQYPFVPGQAIDVHKVNRYMQYKGYPWGTLDLGLLNEELLKEF